MNFEPVRSATVSRARLRHADVDAFSQTARFARGAILLIYHTLAVVLAVGDGVQVVVRTPEERLQQESWSNQLALMYYMRNVFARAH